MNKFACRYAVLQFVPYRETGEFANVGIVLTCPQTGYFGFKLQTQKHKRVTDFFGTLPPDVYLRGLQFMQAELQRTADLLAEVQPLDRAEHFRQTFDALLHPREALIRFGGARAILTESPAQELERQYDQYVNRVFVAQSDAAAFGKLLPPTLA